MNLPYEGREVIRYSITQPDTIKPIRPEQIVLDFGSDTFDIGSYCYMDRSSVRRLSGGARKVNLSSLDPLRVAMVENMVAHFKDLYESRTLRLASLNTRCRNICTMLDWGDANGHPYIWDSIDSARGAYRALVADLRRKVDQHIMANNTAYQHQQEVKAFLNGYFQINDVERGVNQLVFDTNLVNNTTPVSDDRREKFVAFNTALLNGLFDLVLENKPFPHPVKMPSFVGFTDNIMWLFPVPDWVRHPSSLKANAHKYLGYNYVEGRVNELDEIIHLFKSNSIHSPKTYAKKAIEAANKNINAANTDSNHSIRIRLGLLANLVFFRLFELSTGGTLSTLTNIAWSEELERQIENPANERQGFRSMKFRANGKEVFMQIGVRYMPLLRRFVQLRSYLLNGRAFDKMFFTYSSVGGSRATEPTAFQRYTPKNTLETLRLIYPDYDEASFLHRKSRATKQNNVIRKNDPVTAARIMQHSRRTAIKRYSNGTPDQAESEMESYFTAVEYTLQKTLSGDKAVEPLAVGGCADKKPEPIMLNPPVTPDCENQEGCLFCTNHRANSDEKDCRKLLSARYVISQVSRLSSSAEEFDRVFGPTIRRIDIILDGMRTIRPDMVNIIDNVEKEVELGEMDPYWSAKIEELTELGLL